MNNLITVTIEKIVFGGMGLARYEGLVVFVPYAAPGDVLEVQIINRKKNFLRGKIHKIINPSSQREEPICEHYFLCGGCNLQHLKYSSQLEVKQNILKEWIHVIEKKIHRELFAPDHIQDAFKSIQPSPKKFNYRSRIKLSSDGKNLGFNQFQSHNIVPIKKCYLPEVGLEGSIQKVLNNKENIKNFSEVHIGYNAHKNIEIKWVENENPTSNKINLESSNQTPSLLKNEVSNGNSKTIQDSLPNEEFAQEPVGFTQVNSDQNEFLRKKIAQYYLDSKAQVVLDLYGGSGNFSLDLLKNNFCNSHIESLICVEASSEAVKMGFELLKSVQDKNQIKKVHLIQSKTEAFLKRYLNSNQSHQSFLIIDPPRSGCSTETLDALIELRPKALIYISCDPPSWARDMTRLLGKSDKKNPQSLYKIKEVLCVDMFPQTSHMEVVCYLTLN